LSNRGAAAACDVTRHDSGVNCVPDALRSERIRIVAAVLAIGVLGFGLRIANLGGPDFGVDEIFHVYSAQRIVAGESPLLPSGLPYTRSLPYTRTVAWAGALFGGVNEWTARLPSVVFGCLSILVVFAIARQWYSSTAGLIAAFVTAVAPMQVAHSRQVRMYALVQFLYLIIIYLLFQAFETVAPLRRSRVPHRFAAWCRNLEVRPSLLLLALPLIVLARHTHSVILPSLTGPATYIVVMALVSPIMRGISPMARVKYWGAAALLIAVALLILFLDVASLRTLYEEARFYAPTWAQGQVGNWRFYLYAFDDLYPTIFGTFLLAAALALIRNWKATLYLLTCFTVPFLLHSFLLAQKEDRYLFHIMPLMFVIFGVAVSASLATLYRSLAAWAANAMNANSKVVAGTVTLLAVTFLFGATRELREGVKLHNLDVALVAGVQHFNWKRTMEFIAERAQPADVIITSRSLATHYYGPPLPLYSLNEQELDSILTAYPRDENGRPRDYSTGAPVVLGINGLREVLDRHQSGWLVAEGPQMGSVSIPPEIARYIDHHLTREAVPGADDMVLFSWGRTARIDADSAPDSGARNAL
jgi:4-amino-4-deoxy-L-arabinose transferase-like glycosyltransferase